MNRLIVSLLAVWATGACGGERQAFIALRISSAASLQARRFPPAGPEPWVVSVQVQRSDELPFGTVAHASEEWNLLEQDPGSGKRTFLLEVPANDGVDYQYLVRVSSQVDDGNGNLGTDECGVTGRVTAPAGKQVAVEIGTHMGDCSPLLCQERSDCVGTTRYCLSFECYDRASCGSCPEGAHCDDDGFCTGDCSTGDDCASGFVCCQGICARACPGA